jgi:hypothetical protein
VTIFIYYYGNIVHVKNVGQAGIKPHQFIIVHVGHHETIHVPQYVHVYGQVTPLPQLFIQRPEVYGIQLPPPVIGQLLVLQL